MEREQTTIRLPVELKERINHIAVKNGSSFNSVIIFALNEARNLREKSCRFVPQNYGCVKE